jgi:hypothetical protein
LEPGGTEAPLSGNATLIADGGESAAERDFFRSIEFLAAEEVTHTLQIVTDGQVLRAPVKVNSINGGRTQDAASPYGYPGFSGNGEVTADSGTIDFTETRLVAVFLRHRLDDVPFVGATQRNQVFVADPGERRKSRPQDRRQVEKNIERGYGTEILRGPDTSPGERSAFADVYRQTMVRRGARKKYFFPNAYFDQTRLVITRDAKGSVAAASIAVLSDGFIHYYLSGSSDCQQGRAPTKNVVTALVDWSYEAGLPLNLGGGLTEGDSLSMFKRGFANSRLRLHTSEIICDGAAYARLAGSDPSIEYFPAYRASES